MPTYSSEPGDSPDSDGGRWKPNEHGSYTFTPPEPPSQNTVSQPQRQRNIPTKGIAIGTAAFVVVAAGIALRDKIPNIGSSNKTTSTVSTTTTTSATMPVPVQARIGIIDNNGKCDFTNPGDILRSSNESLTKVVFRSREPMDVEVTKTSNTSEATEQKSTLPVNQTETEYTDGVFKYSGMIDVEAARNELGANGVLTVACKNSDGSLGRVLQVLP